MNEKANRNWGSCCNWLPGIPRESQQYGGTCDKPFIYKMWDRTVDYVIFKFPVLQVQHNRTLGSP